jgi:uncharacterized protein YkwD
MLIVAIPLLAASPSPFVHDMLAAHNAVRGRAGVPRLVWSGRLAIAAEYWADTLVKSNKFEHNPKTPYGENLFEIVGASASPAEIVSEWASEEKNYNHATNSCSRVCGHYTQIVWRDTRELGCAVARRGHLEICVCEYDPPGNIVGQRPY